jgi:hypothetical protein
MPGARGGMALDFRRGRSSKERLRVDWTYPVWKPRAAEAAAGGTTVAVEIEHALPLDQAFAWVAGDDHRPLLVLRECDLCKGTDHALLSRTLDNEQTVLLTHWFRCVKLPTNVLDAKHPFTALFRNGQSGEHLPHLFFCDADGEHYVPLPGDQTQSQLWETMLGFLERSYKGDAMKAVKELRVMLSQFDRIDALEDTVLAKLDDELDRNGSKSPKAGKYQADLDKLAKDRAELVQKEQKVRALALRDLNSAAPAAAGDSAAPK